LAKGFLSFQEAKAKEWSNHVGDAGLNNGVGKSTVDGLRKALNSINNQSVFQIAHEPI